MRKDSKLIMRINSHELAVWKLEAAIRDMTLSDLIRKALVAMVNAPERVLPKNQ